MHLPTSEDFLSRTCHGLSGGQRQRVAIARALVTDPVLLVADEITAMLDPSTQAVILRELKRLQHERGFSMLFISHNIHLARKVADRVYVLDRGFIVEQDTVFESLTDQTEKCLVSWPSLSRPVAWLSGSHGRHGLVVSQSRRRRRSSGCRRNRCLRL